MQSSATRTPASPGVFRGRERKKEGAGQDLAGRRCSPGPWQGVTSDLLGRDERQIAPLARNRDKTMLGLYALPLKLVLTASSILWLRDLFRKSNSKCFKPKEGFIGSHEWKNLSAGFPGAAGLRDSKSVTHLSFTALRVGFMLWLHAGTRSLLTTLHY